MAYPINFLKRKTLWCRKPPLHIGHSSILPLGQRMGSSLFCVQNPNRLTSGFQFPPFPTFQGSQEVRVGEGVAVQPGCFWRGGGSHRGKKKALWRERRTFVPLEGRIFREHQGPHRIFLAGSKIAFAPQQSDKGPVPSCLFFSYPSHAGGKRRALSTQMHF